METPDSTPESLPDASPDSASHPVTPASAAPDSDAADTTSSDAADAVDAVDSAASAQRLIEVIGELADFDVIFSSDADRQAVQEMIELTTDEHRTALLIGLLLERIRR